MKKVNKPQLQNKKQTKFENMNKLLLLIVLLLIISINSEAQITNPYKQFGYQPKNQYVVSKKNVFDLYNADTSSVTNKIIFDFQNQKVYFVTKDGKVLGYYKLADFTLYRWLSPDPKQSKFPNESPYIFVSNSPLLHMDPDGAEKIVVTGGADLHNKNRMNFATASQTQLKNYARQVKKQQMKENVAWIIMAKDYTEAEKNGFTTWAKKNGVQTPIFVNSADDVKNYINSKST